MDSTNDFDVIIIGGGVGGLTVGALCSAKEGKKVLILEKEDHVGGRAIHFRGADIKEPDDYLAPLGKITGWLARSEPDLQTMIDKKLLHGYAFEAGWHGLLYGNQSRICHVLNALGKPLDNIAPYVGFAWWDNGKLYKVLDKGPFPWMSEADFKEMHRIAGEVFRMSMEEARSYNHITLMEWLKQRTDNQKVLEFYDLNGGFLIGLNSAREVSAGEYILTTRAAAHAGVSIISGSVATATEPGLHRMAYDLADVIVSHGGEIRLNNKVQRLMIESKTAVGVVTQGEKGEQEIRAAQVVCNVPLKYAVKSDLLPRDVIPGEFFSKVDKLIPVGGFCPHFGLNRKLLDVPGMYMTKVYPDKRLFPEGIAFGYIAHSLVAEDRAPKGKQIIEVWLGFSTKEIKHFRKTGTIDLLCDLTLDFMKKHHPGFEESLEWALFPVIDHVLSSAPTAENVWENMPDPKCPGIENLFLVGDSVRNFAQYTDGVAHGALICMNRMTGKDYLQMIPEYQR